MNRLPDVLTDDDLANETAAITRAASVLHCDGYLKLSKYHPIDFALEKSRRVVFWAEVKCRTCASDKYLDLAIAAKKVAAMMAMQVTTGVPAVLIVRWTDCLGLLTFPCAATFCDVGGRRDRPELNLPNDIEPMMHFPVDLFRRVPLEGVQK